MKWLVMCVIMACGCRPESEPVAPNEPDHQPTPEEAEDDFERVCGKLRELECEEGFNTPEGNTCETVFRNAAREGIDLLGDVECTMGATTCPQARECELRE